MPPFCPSYPNRDGRPRTGPRSLRHRCHAAEHRGQVVAAFPPGLRQPAGLSLSNFQLTQTSTGRYRRNTSRCGFAEPVEAACRATQPTDEELFSMSIQDVAEKMSSRVENSGFDRSVKFDTGSRRRHRHRRRVDFDHRRTEPTAPSSCRSTIWNRWSRASSTRPRPS